MRPVQQSVPGPADSFVALQTSVQLELLWRIDFYAAAD